MKALLSPRYLWVWLLFCLLLGLLASALRHDPRAVPSPMIDQPAPVLKGLWLFRADRAKAMPPNHQVWLLHVWSTWCETCRAAHATWVKLLAKYPVPVVALSYSDDAHSVDQWLHQAGNPFNAVLLDPDGDVAMAWGVVGVPETFLIDAQGVVRAKYSGPITATRWREAIWPTIMHWRAEAVHHD